jgi:hypothetical protein
MFRVQIKVLDFKDVTALPPQKSHPKILGEKNPRFRIGTGYLSSI